MEQEENTEGGREECDRVGRCFHRGTKGEEEELQGFLQQELVFSVEGSNCHDREKIFVSSSPCFSSRDPFLLRASLLGLGDRPRTPASWKEFEYESPTISCGIYARV